MTKEVQRMIIQGDCLERLREFPDTSINCCVTSPPYYGLRDYGIDGQIGLEESPEKYVLKLVDVFREVYRVLKDDGTLWLNLGDSYWANRSNNGLNYDGEQGKHGAHSRRAGNKEHEYLKPKDLIGIPWMVAFALQRDGWYLRSDIIWNKSKCLPESVTDRPSRSHEYIFLFSKNGKYYYDHESIKEPTVESSQKRLMQRIDQQQGSERANAGNKSNGSMKAVGDTMTRNKKTVWTMTTANFSDAHFATFPPKLIEPCIIAGCPIGGTVLDPFNGAGTTGLVAMQNGREYIGIELNPEYVEITNRRLSFIQPVMNF
jgi:DNA modification methylase